VDGVILFIETSIGIFETDLEIIDLIAGKDIPHVLFANRDDFSKFEMDTHVEGVLIIPTIAQDGIGINDGLKMLLKLIDNHEKEYDLIENHETTENNDTPEPPLTPETEFSKLRFFFHPVELDNVKKSLAKFGFSNLTLIDIKYQNYQEEKTETYRGSSYELQLPPKIEMMMITKKEEIEYVIKALETVKTEDISEKLFISPVEDIIRIRTTEKGENAID
jgi:nitrogen regulatory protein PII